MRCVDCCDTELLRIRFSCDHFSLLVYHRENLSQEQEGCQVSLLPNDPFLKC